MSYHRTLHGRPVLPTHTDVSQEHPVPVPVPAPSTSTSTTVIMQLRLSTVHYFRATDFSAPVATATNVLFDPCLSRVTVSCLLTLFLSLPFNFCFRIFLLAMVVTVHALYQYITRNFATLTRSYTVYWGYHVRADHSNSQSECGIWLITNICVQ